MISAFTHRLLGFLSDPASYAHRPPQVTMVQTHASWVFIASPFVYKIKKPVNLGFLDFSTLELRHADCEHELSLNRRLADDIYLSVEPITEQNGSLGFASEGTVVEWVLKMRELDPRFFLKQRLKDHDVDCGDMDRIVEKLHRFYTTQPPLPAESIASAVDHLRQWSDDNFAAAGQYAGQSVSMAALDAISRYTHAFFDHRRELLTSRLDEGWIRDCHGDLHLEHIHLAPDAVRIYDCIEFNTDFRHIDVACDLAFLAMDLDFNERPDLAQHIVDESARLLQDSGMKSLMDFYKCYRACVRGKVESLHAMAETVSEAEKGAARQLARSYFRLALRYAIAGSSPCAFVLMGKIASGKSVLAAALGEETGWPVISSDRERKTLAKVPLHRRGSTEERAALYTQEMTARTYERLLSLATDALQRGHHVIIDATFSKQAQRLHWKDRLLSAGNHTVWIEASASEPVVRERLLQRDQSDAVVSDARLEDYRALSAGYEQPDELSAGEKLTISTDGELPHVLRALMGGLAAHNFTHGG